jgi:hypothetical protein
MASPGFGVFDDFQRSVADGWGTSSSSIPWVDNTVTEEGQTSAQLGNHMSVNGAGAALFDLGNLAPSWMQTQGGGPWQQPGWTMSTTFRVSDVPTNDNQFTDIYFTAFTALPYGDGPLLHLQIGHDSTGPVQAGIYLLGEAGSNATWAFVPKSDWQSGIAYNVE